MDDRGLLIFREGCLYNVVAPYRVEDGELLKNGWTIIKGGPWSGLLEEAKRLNSELGMTGEQKKCPHRGEFGRTSPVGFAPVSRTCPECGVSLVPFFGPFMKHPP